MFSGNTCQYVAVILPGPESITTSETSESGRCICAKWVQRGGRRKGKSPQHAGERGREEEGTVWYRGRRECMGHRVQHSWLHAFRMDTGFTVPSQGRRGTAPLNQLCHFYACRLIFVEFYYLQCVCLLPRARALCAYVDARLLDGCKRVMHFPEKTHDDQTRIDQQNIKREM